MKNIMFICLLIALIILSLVGCDNGNNVDPSVSKSSGDIKYESGDVYIPLEKTYGNGTSFVSYKGNIYYIEFVNKDFEDSTKNYNFAKENISSNEQRYINIIKPNGNISNLFNVSGVTSFSIYDDRFYFVKSNGTLHSTNMKGEDDKELGRGKFVAFDSANHVVYYTLDNMKDKLYHMNMKNLEIGYEDYSNSYDEDEYTCLGFYDGFLYYYKIDSNYDNIMFVRHDLKGNTDSNICTEKINKDREEIQYAKEVGRYTNVLNSQDDRLKFISIGYYDGSGLFFTYGKLFEFDMTSEEVQLLTGNLQDERVCVIGNKLYYLSGNLEKANLVEYDLETNQKNELIMDYSIIKEPALIEFNGVYSSIDRPFSKAILESASKYGLYEKSFIKLESGDLVEKYPYITGFSDYDIFSSDVKVIGNNIFYTINYGKLNPTIEEHDRGTVVPVYVRRAQEIYLYNIDSGKNSLIYAITNKNFINELKNIEDRIENNISNRDDYETPKSSGDKEEKPHETPLKNDEMYLEIDTSNIWKDEFDVKIEQTGGTIFGKRIAYEGHHTKDEGKLKVKIKNEHGARLIVYIDNDIFSDTVMD